MDWGLYGGLIGGFLGIVGGVIGTYASISNTKSPLERRFMVRVSFYFWAGIITFLLLMWLIPRPYNSFLWIPYGVLLPISIRVVNKQQTAIRELQSKERLAKTDPQ